jgi:predicted acylesterase/phospholipase RssA
VRRVGVGGSIRGLSSPRIRRFSLAQTVAPPPADHTVPSPDASKGERLRVEDVKHLAFEGGGGKGFAYLGALAALENLGILPVSAGSPMPRSQIEAVSGASAGAITALCVSLGWTSQQILSFINDKKTDFDSFFDPPRPRYWPRVGGRQPVKDTKEEAALVGNPPGWLFEETPLALVSEALELIRRFRQELEESTTSHTLADRLKSYWWDYLVYLDRDMGIFHADAARKMFLRIIRETYQRRGKSAPHNPTFKNLYDDLQADLIVTGSNLTLGQTQLFSRRKNDTPEFPVADAIRISMSIPFVFKPYVLDEDTFHGHPPCGTYVDGGVWNNIPFREFDTTAVGFKPSTLALRLEIEPASPIHSFDDFVGQYVGKFGLFGAGETQVLSKYLNQAILLDTGKLGLLDFKPSPVERRHVTRRSFAAVYRYFRVPLPLPGAAEFPVGILGNYSNETWQAGLAADKAELARKLSAQSACTQPRDPDPG